MENEKSKAYCLDASIRNADWVKRTWDLPELGSAEFFRWFKRSGMTMDAFKALPIYSFNKQLDMFPPPPVTGSELLVPITTKTGMYEEMLETGAEFDDFWYESVQGRVAYFFRWLGEFRATVLVVWGDEGVTHIEIIKSGSLSLIDEERQSVRDEVTRLFQEADGKAVLAEARRIFEEEHFGFPSIPGDLATRLRKNREWLYSSRIDPHEPYFLEYFLDELKCSTTDDYVILGHSGYGINCWALHYYLVHGPLRMFIQIGWGGVNMDKNDALKTIRKCFHLADQIVVTSELQLKSGDIVTVVASDARGCYWISPGKSHEKISDHGFRPVALLNEVLVWLKGRDRQS